MASSYRRAVSASGQPGPDPVPGQVLDHAVVLVPPAELAYLRDQEGTDAAQPRSQIVHARTRYRLARFTGLAARVAGAGA